MREALRHRSFALGAALVALLVAAAALSLAWTLRSPYELDVPNKLGAPSAAHWLGTDSLGRDVASLLLVGAQNSIVVGVVAVGIGVLFGVALGFIFPWIHTLTKARLNNAVTGIKGDRSILARKRRMIE